MACNRDDGHPPYFPESPGAWSMRQEILRGYNDKADQERRHKEYVERMAQDGEFMHLESIDSIRPVGIWPVSRYISIFLGDKSKAKPGDILINRWGKSFEVGRFDEIRKGEPGYWAFELNEKGKRKYV